MKKSTIILGTLIAGLSLPSFAGQVYVGINGGQAEFQKAKLSIPGVGSGSVELDQSSMAGELLAGYQFNEYISVEVSVGGYDAIDAYDGSVGNMVYFSAQPKLSLPLNDYFSLFGKVGLSHFSATGMYQQYEMTKSDVTLKYTVGGEAMLTDNLRLNLQLDYMSPEFEENVEGYNVKLKTDIKTMMVGASYHF